MEAVEALVMISGQVEEELLIRSEMGYHQYLKEVMTQHGQPLL